MSKKNFRVTIKERISAGNEWNHNVDIDDLQELVEELHREKISRISLKHGAFVADFDITRKDNISIDELTEDDFKYLTEDKPGYFMFLVVEQKEK